MIWLSTLGFGTCPSTGQTQVWLFAAALGRLFNLPVSVPSSVKRGDKSHLLRPVVQPGSGGSWRVPATVSFRANKSPTEQTFLINKFQL